MKFSVKAWSKGGGRAGVLQVGNCSLETPALLLTTRKGLPAFISPDLLSSLPNPDSRLLQFSPLHFSDGILLKTISEIGGLHQLLGLKEHVFMAIPRDSIISLPDYQSANKMGASFETPSGRLLIKPVQYMEMISSMRPNMWATLADEVPAWVSEKRNRTSVDRTVRWLDDCITSNYTAATGGAVFGSIVGGSKIEERKCCAQEVAKRDVSGFCIGGFGLGESMDERPALITAITESLPEDKPRHICGLGLPEEVLQGVAAGIDLFDSSYIYHLTLGGFALTFPLEQIERHNSDDQLRETSGTDCTKISLKATIYRKDTSAIVEGCKCYTCENHSKAYINHLFIVHEMLAQILLEIHNTHHYLGFFRDIREAIKRGTFDEFRQTFVEDPYAAPIDCSAGKRPPPVKTPPAKKSATTQEKGKGKAIEGERSREILGPIALPVIPREEIEDRVWKLSAFEELGRFPGISNDASLMENPNHLVGWEIFRSMLLLGDLRKIETWDVSNVVRVVRQVSMMMNQLIFQLGD